MRVYWCANKTTCVWEELENVAGRKEGVRRAEIGRSDGMRSSSQWCTVIVNACVYECIWVLIVAHGDGVTTIRGLMKRCCPEEEMLERRKRGLLVESS